LIGNAPRRRWYIGIAEDVMSSGAMPGERSCCAHVEQMPAVI
jgi:hypothetical protein